MLRFLLAIIGVVLLVGGAFLGLGALLPAPTERVSFGGAQMTVQALSMQVESPPGGAPEIAMPVELDGVEVANPQALDLNPQVDIAALDAQPAASAPSAQELSNEVVVPLATMAFTAEGEPPPPAPIVEQRMVELEWPQQFRLGGSSLVRLTFKAMGDGSIQPVAEFEGNTVVATPILLTDRYDTHDAVAEAMLAAPTFAVASATPLEQPLRRGETVEWLWTLSPEEAGEQVLALSITVRWTPRGGGVSDSITVWNEALPVQVGQIFGLTVPQAGIAGTVAAVLGVVLEIPFLDSILGFLWGRRPRRRRRERR